MPPRPRKAPGPGSTSQAAGRGSRPGPRRGIPKTKGSSRDAEDAFFTMSFASRTDVAQERRSQEVSGSSSSGSSSDEEGGSSDGRPGRRKKKPMLRKPKGKQPEIPKAASKENTPQAEPSRFTINLDSEDDEEDNAVTPRKKPRPNKRPRSPTPPPRSPPELHTKMNFPGIPGLSSVRMGQDRPALEVSSDSSSDELDPELRAIKVAVRSKTANQDRGSSAPATSRSVSLDPQSNDDDLMVTIIVHMQWIPSASNQEVSDKAINHFKKPFEFLQPRTDTFQNLFVKLANQKVVDYDNLILVNSDGHQVFSWGSPRSISVWNRAIFKGYKADQYATLKTNPGSSNHRNEELEVVEEEDPVNGDTNDDGDILNLKFRNRKEEAQMAVPASATVRTLITRFLQRPEAGTTLEFDGEKLGLDQVIGEICEDDDLLDWH